MKSSKKLIALAGVLALGLAANAANADDKEGMEKCYGVAKAGKNDCGANGHSCAGHSAKDADPAEWVLAPKGFCEKLANGSLEAPKS